MNASMERLETRSTFRNRGILPPSQSRPHPSIPARGGRASRRAAVGSSHGAAAGRGRGLRSAPAAPTARRRARGAEQATA